MTRTRHKRDHDLGHPLVLPPSHRAVVRGEPLFMRPPGPNWRGGVGPYMDGEWILKKGEYNPKLGSGSEKGRDREEPLFYVTLREMLDCLRSCPVWNRCYGNRMPFARRFEITPAFYERMKLELDYYQLVYPSSFRVRLHQLGDFPSLEYVEFIRRMLPTHRALKLLVYTAWPEDSEIGQALKAILNEFGWARFPLHFSVPESTAARPGLCTVLTKVPDHDHHNVDGWTVCPQAMGKVSTCAEGCLCMVSAVPIAFVAH